MVSAEDKMETCKGLVNWSKNRGSGSIRYMENRIYAVSVGYGVVTLIEADSNDDAYEKVFGFKRGDDIIDNRENPCEGCKHDTKGVYDEPCKRCKRIHYSGDTDCFEGYHY